GVELYAARAVAQDALVAPALHGGRLLAGLREIVRIDRRARSERTIEVRTVDLVRDDGHALGRERAQAAGVIEVVMAVDDVAHRLAGRQPARLLQPAAPPPVLHRPPPP